MTRIILLIIILSSCSRIEVQSIDKHVARYNNLLLKIEGDSLADCYTIDGELAGENQNSVFGRDSIRKLFKSFAGVHILEYTSKADSTIFLKDFAVQKGTYFQKVIVASGDTLELGGQYESTWIKDKHDWLIKKMYTYQYRNFKDERRIKKLN